MLSADRSHPATPNRIRDLIATLFSKTEVEKHDKDLLIVSGFDIKIETQSSSFDVSASVFVFRVIWTWFKSRGNQSVRVKSILFPQVIP